MPALRPLPRPPGLPTPQSGEWSTPDRSRSTSPAQVPLINTEPDTPAPQTPRPQPPITTTDVSRLVAEPEASEHFSPVALSPIYNPYDNPAGSHHNHPSPFHHDRSATTPALRGGAPQMTYSPFADPSVTQPHQRSATLSPPPGADYSSNGRFHPVSPFADANAVGTPGRQRQGTDDDYRRRANQMSGYSDPLSSAKSTTDVDAYELDEANKFRSAAGMLGNDMERKQAEHNPYIHDGRSSHESHHELLLEKGGSLDPTEKEDEDKKDDPKDAKLPPVDFTGMFRYATRGEVILNWIGLLAAICAGSAQPLMSFIFGKLTQDFVKFATLIKEGAATGNEKDALLEARNIFRNAASKDATYLVYIGLGMFVATYTYMHAWTYTGEVNAKRIREKYLAAILRQDIAYFDNIGPGEIATRIETDTHLVQVGISEKVALSAYFLAGFFVSFIVAFYRNWRLALALSSIVPCIIISAGFMNAFVSTYTRLSLGYIAEGGSLAEEVISSIRSAQAFGIQKRLAGLYERHVQASHYVQVRAAAWQGGGMGAFLFLFYSAYALAFYFGTTLIIQGHATSGQVVSVFFAVIMGAFSLGLVAPELQAIANARGACAKLFATIDRVPPIDSADPGGLKPAKVVGDITLENVDFHYPSRPDVQIVKGLSLRFPPKSTCALVGASGSGKSTVISLVERFYDPQAGIVRLDGVNIRDLNVRWLRSQIGLVGQEPVLFQTTIRGNVAQGLNGTQHEDAPKAMKDALVLEACIKANADTFIQNLPHGYDTMVGERGFLLSGGQKQRIAIARAIVSNPRILLLDEATSALDTQSESIVQAALDKAAEGRTTITIAHRLSTVKNASRIIVMGGGVVLEEGTHNELLQQEGAYAKLVSSQQVREIHNEDDDDEFEGDEYYEQDYDDDDTDAAITFMNRAPFARLSWMTTKGLRLSLKRRFTAKSKRYTRRETMGEGLSRRDTMMTMASRHTMAKEDLMHEPDYYNKKRMSMVSRRTTLKRSDTRKSTATTATAIARRRSMAAAALVEAPPVNYSLPYLFMRMGMINRAVWKKYAFGTIFAIMTGSVYPSFGIVFAKGVTGFSDVQNHDKRIDGNRNALYLFIIAIAATFTSGMQNYLFASAAANLTARLRSLTFAAIIRQDVKFFDKDENSTGALTTKLGQNPQKISGLAGITLAAIVQSMATIVVGMILGVVFIWKVGLVGFACMPLLVSAGYVRLRVVMLRDQQNKAAHEESAAVACEAAAAIKTVASLKREKECVEIYSRSLAGPLENSKKSAPFTNGLFAFSQSLSFFVIAVVFWYGSRLVSNFEFSTFDFFVGLLSTVFGAIQAGNVFSFAPDISSAVGAAAEIIQLIDARPTVDAEATNGKAFPDRIKGRIRFEHVKFEYPTRPGIPILRDLNLAIEPGTYVAFVGASGCGKSTALQLIERFYDPIAGRVNLDGTDISKYNVSDYRKCISLVSQEPTLYAGTIRFNILLGATKPHEDVTQEEIEDACRSANILDFVNSLPDGFDTDVGGKGSQLSGGQKQRIAIARALLRDPRILLLDEATSALDSNSEKVVQAALDSARKGRTTIAIAHRLSTIQDADRIFFFKDGVVHEFGTHDELLAKRGAYMEYVQLQSLSQG